MLRTAGGLPVGWGEVGSRGKERLSNHSLQLGMRLLEILKPRSLKL